MECCERQLATPNCSLSKYIETILIWFPRIFTHCSFLTTWINFHSSMNKNYYMNYKDFVKLFVDS